MRDRAHIGGAYFRTHPLLRLCRKVSECGPGVWPRCNMSWCKGGPVHAEGAGLRGADREGLQLCQQGPVRLPLGGEGAGFTTQVCHTFQLTSNRWPICLRFWVAEGGKGIINSNTIAIVLTSSRGWQVLSALTFQKLLLPLTLAPCFSCVSDPSSTTF